MFSQDRSPVSSTINLPLAAKTFAKIDDLLKNSTDGTAGLQIQKTAGVAVLCYPNGQRPFDLEETKLLIPREVGAGVVIFLDRSTAIVLHGGDATVLHGVMLDIQGRADLMGTAGNLLHAGRAAARAGIMCTICNYTGGGDDEEY